MVLICTIKKKLIHTSNWRHQLTSSTSSPLLVTWIPQPLSWKQWQWTSQIQHLQQSFLRNEEPPCQINLHRYSSILCTRAYSKEFKTVQTHAVHIQKEIKVIQSLNHLLRAKVVWLVHFWINNSNSGRCNIPWLQALSSNKERFMFHFDTVQIVFAFYQHSLSLASTCTCKLYIAHVVICMQYIGIWLPLLVHCIIVVITNLCSVFHLKIFHQAIP